jgi:hypothetical protein
MNQVLTCHINEKWNLLLNDFFSMQDWNLRVRIGWRNNVSHEQIFWGGGTHSSKYAWKNYCLKKYLHKYISMIFKNNLNLFLLFLLYSIFCKNSRHASAIIRAILFCKNAMKRIKTCCLRLITFRWVWYAIH